MVAQRADIQKVKKLGGGVVLPSKHPAAQLVAQCFDGRTSIEDIQREMERQLGEATEEK